MSTRFRRRAARVRAVESPELQRQTLRVGLLLAVLVAAVAGLVRATS